ncbi:DUF7848 domain-containing protein [Streptomyces sp. NBC_01803]|uniref:DUF7848 domain-containing protein n=1 Tax=Streptomyces sp. NBC_01803 TaxID=2975946 RepID=UPI003FA3C23A
MGGPAREGEPRASGLPGARHPPLPLHGRGVAVTHTVIRGAEWTLTAERAEGAPAGRYAAECMTCGEASPWADNDPKPVGMWALDHTHRHGLTHSQFLSTAQRHWRVDPVRSGHGPSARPGDRPPRAHARPPARRLRRLTTRAGRLAGALVLTVSARCLPSLGARRTPGGARAD